MVAAEPALRVATARRRGRRRGADEGVGRGALPALLRRAADGERRPARRRGRPHAARGRHLLRARERRRARRVRRLEPPRQALHRAAATRATTHACSTPRPSRRACGRCSSAPTGRAAGSGGDHRRVRGGRAARGLPAARARRHAAGPAALPRLRLRAARGPRRDDARRRRRSQGVAMQKPIA